MKFLFASLCLIAASLPVFAATIDVAVASNFSAPIHIIASQFQKETGHVLRVSIGSTGSLYAQIKNGAPFDIFLAADTQTPAKIGKEGLGIASSQFTYARGRLVLWSAQTHVVDSQGDVLKKMAFNKIVMANPQLAPYGLAAQEVLQQLGLQESLKTKIVMGDNISQAYQFIATQNASLGFVALSQVMEQGLIQKGSVWLIPTQLHTPLKQDAILLRKAEKNKTAISFLQYLKKSSTQQLIRSYGYDL